MPSKFCRKQNNQEDFDCIKSLNKIMILGLTSMAALGASVLLIENSKSQIPVNSNFSPDEIQDLEKTSKSPFFRPSSKNDKIRFLNNN